MLVKRFDCVADRCWRRTGAAKRVCSEMVRVAFASRLWESFFFAGYF